MAQNIDRRVVSMEFDNSQFNNKVSGTISVLDKFKASLNMSDSAKGLEKVGESANKVKFDGMSNGIETVKEKFSALEVMAISALANITTKAVDAGINLVKSLSIEPIMDGFREYETQMNAIQTILSNTASKGTTLEDVKASLAELNTYADKTIYNFTEMTRNIGTFTAAGVDLETSTKAIKGIANLAAASGSNSEQASRAMYQLSQAIAAGKVNLQDWNSVVNAGMGGQMFQNALKETAKAMGICVDESVSFRESISAKDGTGWLTSDVLLSTLENFTGDLTDAELAAKGFTEEQIKDIQAMGQNANDAATKVKTFTQLMDTLKEAVGSGWAQTFQIIFGDFEEAKEMFTAVSDTLGAFISDSANARNNLLQGWSDLGGRSMVIDTIANAFHNLVDILSTVSNAFKDVFPPMTSQQLMDITTKIHDLISNFKLSDNALQNLGNTARGIFSIFDIVKNVFMSFGNAIGIALSGSGNLIEDFLQMTGTIGNWITTLDKAIQSSNVFNLAMSIIGDTIKNIFGGIDFVLRNIGSAIDFLASKLNMSFVFTGIQSLNNILSSILTRISEVTSGSISLKTAFGNAFNAMADVVSKCSLVSAIQGIGEAFKSIFDGIKNMLTGIMNSIKNVLGADSGGLGDLLGNISLGALSGAITKLLLDIDKPLSDLASIGDNLTGILDSVRGCFEAYQQNLKADALKKIAVAIGILSASIFALSKIDPDRLGSSLAAIGGLFSQLLGAMYVYTKIGDLSSVSVKANATMILMSTAILILSKAMVTVAQLDWNGVAKGGVGILTMAGTLVAAAKLMDGTKSMKGVTQMIVFAGAIKILASVCTDLSSLSWEGLAKGLTGVMALIGTISLFLNNTSMQSKSVSTAAGILILSGAIKMLGSAAIDLSSLDWEGLAKGLGGVMILLTSISLFLNNTSFQSKGITSATSILILSGAIKVIASATKDFGSMNWEEMKLGLMGLAGALGSITAFTKLNADTKNMISMGTGMIALGAGVKIIASAVRDFSGFNWEELKIGLMGLGGSLTIVAIAMKAMPNNMISTGAGLAMVSASLLLLAQALNSMGNMNWQQLSVGLVALGGSLTILAVALNAMQGTLAGSAALLVAAGAIAVLAPALTLMSNMSWEGLLIGLIGLAGAIGVFAGAAALLSPIIPAMLGLSAAMLAFSASIVGIGAGLTLIGTGLTAVATGLTALAASSAVDCAAIVASFGIIVSGIVEMIPMILTEVANGIVQVITVIGESSVQMAEAVMQVIQALLDVIVQNTPSILDKVLTILSQVLEAVIKWTPTIGQQVVTILIEILNIIANSISQFVQAAVNIIIGFVQGISQSLPKIADAAFQCIITFINGLSDAIRSNSGALADACANLVSAVVEGVANLGDRFIEMGVNAVKGFISGLGQLGGEVIAAGTSLGEKALNAAKDFLDIHSPSRKFAEIGRFSGAGMVVGLNNYGNKIEKAGINIGQRALNGVKESINKVGNLITDGINDNPTITPVIDLSQVQNGINGMNALMNGGTVTSIKAAANVQGEISSNSIVEKSNTNFNNIETPKPKQSVILKLMLNNGKALAECMIDDIDEMLGNKGVDNGRLVGLN